MFSLVIVGSFVDRKQCLKVSESPFVLLQVYVKSALFDLYPYYHHVGFYLFKVDVCFTFSKFVGLPHFLSDLKANFSIQDYLSI